MYHDPGYLGYRLNNRVMSQREQMPEQRDRYDPDLSEALRLIEEAVQDETHDRLFYQYLISRAPSIQDKDIITGIQNDEMKHFELFRGIYGGLTGNTIPMQQSVPYNRPASYCAGIKDALLGEQNAVTKYRRILYAMRDRKHINIMTEIITDELRHLGLYNYLYAKNRCMN